MVGLTRLLENTSVEQVAPQLLGKVLKSKVGGLETAGIIVEVEAYSHRERGCHAFGNRETKRNGAMFMAAGTCYVYVCYGIHHMFNIVTNSSGVGDAILIRALEPVAGMDVMMHRSGSVGATRITSGPGKLCKALGITKSLDKKSILDAEVMIEEYQQIRPCDIVNRSRIGIDYAGEDANLPWRFYIRNNVWVSKK